MSFDEDMSAEVPAKELKTALQNIQKERRVEEEKKETKKRLRRNDRAEAEVLIVPKPKAKREKKAKAKKLPPLKRSRALLAQEILAARKAVDQAMELVIRLEREKHGLPLDF